MGQNQGVSSGGLSRRRILQGVATAGTGALAGCFDGDDTDESADPERARERDEVDLDTIEAGGTLTVGLSKNPDSFDPVESGETPAATIYEVLWETLLRADADGNSYPWLSESYELVETQDVGPAAYEDYMISAPFDEVGMPELEAQIVVEHPNNDPTTDEEGLFLTVDETQDAVDDGTFGMHFRHVLHEGITFHNGEELTAEHVVRSYERFENARNSGQVFDQFLHADADDKYTVDIYAQFPDAEAERDLLWFVFPMEHIENDAPGDLDPRQGTEPIGTGPWRFETFEDQHHVRLTKTDDYWLEDVGLEAKSWWDGPDAFPASPMIDELDIEIIPDGSQRAAALEEREIDLTQHLPPDTRTNFQHADRFTVSATSGGSYDFLQFPTQVKPWDDANVRRAVNHLIPRTEIVESISDGWATEGMVPLPELAAERGTTDYERLVEDLSRYNTYDPDRAADLIAASDYEPPLEVTIQTHSDNDARVRKTELIVESLNQSDLFEAELETPGDLTTLAGMMSDPEYHLQGYLVCLNLSGTYNPHSFCEAVHHPDKFNECCNFQNPPGSFPDLVEAMDRAQFGADVAADPTLRAERYDDLWKRLLELNANSILEFELSTAALTDDVHGYNAYPFSEDLLNGPLFNPIDEQLTYISRD